MWRHTGRRTVPKISLETPSPLPPPPPRCIVMWQIHCMQFLVLDLQFTKLHRDKRNTDNIKNRTENKNAANTMVKINKLLSELISQSGSISQALPVHLDRGERKDLWVKGDQREDLGIKATMVLLDCQERPVSKESWDLWDQRAMLDSRDKKETWVVQAYRELKENLVNRFQLLLLLCPLKNWQWMRVDQLRFSVQWVVILNPQYNGVKWTVSHN